jgi:hypothetical protein
MGIDIDLNVGDIRHPTPTSVIPISEENMSDWKLSFRYRKNSNIDVRVHSDIWYQKKCHFISACLHKTHAFTGERITPQLLCWSTNWGMSDIQYRIKVYSISDIMSDSALFSRISEVPISTQSDIADHGYRTKCQPMVFTYKNQDCKLIVLS